MPESYVSNWLPKVTGCDATYWLRFVEQAIATRTTKPKFLEPEYKPSGDPHQDAMDQHGNTSLEWLHDLSNRIAGHVEAQEKAGGPALAEKKFNPP